MKETIFIWDIVAFHSLCGVLLTLKDNSISWMIMRMLFDLNGTTTRDPCIYHKLKIFLA